MRIYVIITIFLLLLAALLIIAIGPVLPNHWVGELELQESEIWRKCCEKSDCIVQNIQIIQPMLDEVWTSIDGETVLLSKNKFHPVPSAHTWVCYFDQLEDVRRENIRCILYPNNTPLTLLPG